MPHAVYDLLAYSDAGRKIVTSQIRTVHALGRCVLHLAELLDDQRVQVDRKYSFIHDRLRAIQQELTVQGASSTSEAVWANVISVRLHAVLGRRFTPLLLFL